MSDLASLEQRGLAELQESADEAALRAWHTKYFGKRQVSAALKKVGEVPPAERRAYGQEANRVKEALTRAYEEHSLAKEAETGSKPGSRMRST